MNDTKNEYAYLAESTRDTVDMLEAIINGMLPDSEGAFESLTEYLRGSDADYAEGHKDIDEAIEEADLLDALEFVALETYATANIRLDMPPDIDSVTIVFGTGGPHTQAVLSHNGDVACKAWSWGFSGYVERNTYAPTLAGWLIELYEEGMNA